MGRPPTVCHRVHGRRSLPTYSHPHLPRLLGPTRYPSVHSTGVRQRLAGVEEGSTYDTVLETGVGWSWRGRRVSGDPPGWSGGIRPSLGRRGWGPGDGPGRGERKGSPRHRDRNCKTSVGDRTDLMIKRGILW